jgi:hypothetical protein
VCEAYGPSFLQFCQTFPFFGTVKEGPGRMHFLCQFENIGEVDLEYQDIYGRNLVMHGLFFMQESCCSNLYRGWGGGADKGS